MREEEKESGKRWEESYRRDSWEKINAEVPKESKRKKERKTKCSQGKGRGKNKAGMVHLNTLQRTGLPVHNIRD